MAAKAIGIGALVFFSGEFERAAAFYRALGLPLESETHDDGREHVACELGETHVAIYGASPGAAPRWRESGSSFPGILVESVADSLSAAIALGAVVLQLPEEYPWGLRAVLEDPDGRAVEIYERSQRGRE